MLQRLKFTQLAAELFARAHVVDGHIFNALHQSQSLRAEGQSGARGRGIDQWIGCTFHAQQLSRCVVQRDLAGVATIDSLERMLREPRCRRFNQK